MYWGDIVKKIELLAPAGNMECLKAAVQAGCDAVYFGGIKFGARAFSKNFTDSEIIEAINYCHLYGVKAYITVNTLIYDNEVDDFIKYIEFIHKNNVDAIIIQDLGMFDLVRKTFPNLEIHASTQMHIHNLDGTKLMEDLGMKRVVLARETDLSEIKYIKENSNIDLEVFVHGALCISYSGQCLMSSLIGGRSGNRGACAGSCRLKYDIVDVNGKKLNIDNYPLSTKDLNTLESVGKLIEIGVSSLKIEGRMKSKEYVYMVVSLYREAIDSYYDHGKVYINDDKLLNLKKIFNRDYTKGFLNNANSIEMINGYRPNHMGVDIGIVVNFKKNIAFIKLTDNLSIGSGLRVIGDNHDVGIKVNNFYINNHLVKRAHAGDIISIQVHDKVNIGDKVVVTYDSDVVNDIETAMKKNIRRVSITGRFIGKIGRKSHFIINDGFNNIEIFGNVIEKALNNPIKEETIKEKLEKINDTIYDYADIQIDIDENIFISLTEINILRRKAIDMLNDKRLYKTKYKKEKYNIFVPDFKKEKKLTCLVNKKEDIHEAGKKFDIIYSYSKEDGCTLKLPRVIHNYSDNLKNCLVGEIGAFYKGENLDTDFSFNVVNSYTVAFLHSIGARKITLSYEMNDKQIKNLINHYHDRYKKHPNLELIISSYEEVMVSKVNLEEYYHNKNLYLKDRFGNKYPIVVRDNLMYIYNYRKRECNSKLYYDMGINSLRVNEDL